jgi:4-diphosphocytidyl-2-C-methyl-D-erythritol kinase
LALSAAIMILDKIGVKDGVSMTLEKKIPAGAGLGGGSSNAATVLTGLNYYYGTPFSGKELLEMGVLLGADVPFFIYGRPAIAEGIGDKLVICENIIPYNVIVIYPGFSLSTDKVYKKLNYGLTKREKKIKSRLSNKKLIDPVRFLYNDLEEPSSLLCNDIKLLKNLLASCGAEGVLMSGSGSSVFGLYSELDSARKAFNDLLIYKEDHQQECKKWQLFLTDMIL